MDDHVIGHVVQTLPTNGLIKYYSELILSLCFITPTFTFRGSFVPETQAWPIEKLIHNLENVLHVAATYYCNCH